MGSAEPKTSAAGAVVGGAATASAIADGALAWWNEVLSNAPELGSAASNKLSSTIEGLSTKWVSNSQS